MFKKPTSKSGNKTKNQKKSADSSIIQNVQKMFGDLGKNSLKEKKGMKLSDLIKGKVDPSQISMTTLQGTNIHKEVLSEIQGNGGNFKQVFAEMQIMVDQLGKNRRKKNAAKQSSEKLEAKTSLEKKHKKPIKSASVHCILIKRAALLKKGVSGAQTPKFFQSK